MVQLIRKTLRSLHAQGIEPTPKNYAKEFYKQAKLLDKEVEDLKKFDKVVRSLDNEEQKLVYEKNINTATELLDILTKRIQKSELTSLVNHLALAMKPSIDQTVSPSIDALIKSLKKNPHQLFKTNMLEKIDDITFERVENDRKALKEKSEDMKKLINLLTKHYDRSLIQSDNTSEEITAIKEEVSALKLSDQSNREIVTLQTKLIDTLYNLENSIERTKIDLIRGQSESVALEKKIDELEKELQALQKEKNIDFLTGVMNRRGFTNAVAKMENEYSFFNSNYAIIFYDIDNFKVINDTYGHECGDVILNIFASVLNRLTRENDIISRYGGEEFLALIHYHDEDEIIRYIKRVKEIVAKNKFIYNSDVKLNIKFSAGTTFRNKYNSYEEAIKKADKLLYQAKHQGKDKIIFDNGVEI
jgi:diguanylate cyclase (GGDEF)-like protein